MVRTLWVAGVVTLMSAGCGGPRDVTRVLEDSLAAMGDVSSIEYSGTGMNAFCGQALIAGQEGSENSLAWATNSFRRKGGTPSARPTSPSAPFILSSD